jgi:hypothetical protein
MGHKLWHGTSPKMWQPKEDCKFKLIWEDSDHVTLVQAVSLRLLFCGRMECSLELSAYIATPFHELQLNYKRLEKAPLFFIYQPCECIQAL